MIPHTRLAHPRVLALAALVLAMAGGHAATLTPEPQAARDVQRVEGRDERLVLAFPQAESWSFLERHADAQVATRSFVRQDSLAPGFDFATASTMRNLWNADLEKVQHLFGHKLSAECPDVRARLWLADSLGGRRVVEYACPGAKPPFTVLQLLKQGRDDLFTVELYSRRGLAAAGQLVRWAEWLKEIQLCRTEKGGQPPCPDDAEPR